MSSPSPAPGENASPTIGFIGAGSMGGPMVERMLDAGMPVHLYARRPEVAEHFAGLGAKLAGSPAELAAAVDISLLCPFSAEQVEQIALDPDGVLAHARAGAVVAVHSTVPVATIERLAAEGRARGVQVLDAPISGTSDAIRAGRLTVLAGGAATAVQQCEPVLRSYASTVVHTGEIGSASRVELVNNLTFAAQMQTGVAAVRLGEQLGLEPSRLVEALNACSANSFVFEIMKLMGGPDTLAEQASHYLTKDVAAAEQAAQALGVELGLLREVVRTGPLSLAAP